MKQFFPPKDIIYKCRKYCEINNLIYITCNCFVEKKIRYVIISYKYSIYGYVYHIKFSFVQLNQIYNNNNTEG